MYYNENKNNPNIKWIEIDGATLNKEYKEI